MTCSRLRTFTVLALALLGVSLSGCHSRRPPAVATTPRDAQRDGRSRETTEALPSGPDIGAMAESGATGADLSDGEGGPLLDIHFEYDKATLSDEARGLLEKHALWLQANRDAKVTLEGHCDDRGTVEYNLALGDKRAQAAREYLAGLGVSNDRLSAVSYGKVKPLDPGHSESAWAKNRRVHFRVSR